MKKQIYLIIAFILLSLQAFTQTKTEINNVISNAGTFSKPKPTSSNVVDEKDEIEIVNGIELKCHIKTIQLTQRFDNYITFNDITDLYPGSIIQGKFINEGKLISIGNFKRQPITITVTGLDLGSGMNSKTVENPNKATITEAVNNMIRDYQGTSSNKFIFKKVGAYSKKQALMELGLNVNWLAGSVGGNLELSSFQQEHSIYIYFKQAYYTISVEPPASPASFFSPDVDIEDLKYRIKLGNPAGYVSSVTYGRILVAKMTSTYSQEEMKAAINAKFAFGTVETNAGVEEEKILSTCKFEVHSSGGLISYIPTDINGVAEFINKGLQFENSTQGVPIAYEVKYLADNSPFMIGDETAYKIKKCEDNTKYQNFTVKFDGFKVIQDCDKGSFTDTGEGEFLYQLDINGETKVHVMKSYEAKKANDGGWVPINKDYNITIPYKENECIKITGIFIEYDEYTDSEIIGKINKEHCFPFNTMDLYNTDKNNNPYWKIVISKSSTCKIIFYYQIIKK